MKKIFVHLRQHSDYSLLESSLKINKIVELCEKNEMPSIALTDTQNLFGSFEFSTKCQQQGIQPIIGVNLKIEIDKSNDASEILLLAKNVDGYTNLIKLMIKYYSAEKKINLIDLKQHSSGLICLTGGAKGPFGKLILKNDLAEAEKLLINFLDIYNSNLFIEISRHGLEIENRTENLFIEYAYKHNIPIVATNNNLFSDITLHEANDALMCIKNNDKLSQEDRKKTSKECYFKSTEEMIKLFSDLPEAISNTILIAKRCLFLLEETTPTLPKIFNSNEIEYKKLSNLSFNGLNKKLEFYKLNLTNDDFKKKKKFYEDRLNYELNIIKKTGYSGYFLIVADFIMWAKSKSIPVGPGRGSGAGSLVAWSINITELDPIKYKLLFERFLNPDRVTLPDFDIDFCQERRIEVLKYVVKKYGRKKVAQIITFGKLQSRNVVRDVGRVLQMPYSQIDNIAKLIPYNPANPISLNDAINNESKLKDLQKNDDSVTKLIDISLKLEGLYRHASTHAAGIVIGDKDLDKIIPFFRDDPDTGLPVSQFSMDYVQQAGLIKFDFLGLKTLTIINKTLELINKNERKIELQSLPLDDKKTFDLLKNGKTTGCFQLESSGVKEYLKKLSPDRFEDIIAMVSLYRPGPMEYIENYINRKHGKEEIIYLHPLLETVLKETYGITIYQEQVMQIAQVLAGFTLSQADTLRWAIGKRKKKLMSSLKENFINGCIKNKVKEYQAVSIFKQVETFAGYGFNKSHAAGYALIAYQTAYLKSNYPIEFMTASMNHELNNTDKINRYLEDCREMNIRILKPNINYSKSLFTIEINKKINERCIRYGLSALKNVGSGVTTNIVIERKKNGLYKDVNNFCSRLDDENLNIRQLEYLIKSGSFDILEKNRAKLYNNINKIVQIIRSNKKNKNQDDLFSNNPENNIIYLNKYEDWDETTKINYEYESVGFYLSEHPLKRYKNFFEQNNFINISTLKKIMNNSHANEKKFFKIPALILEKKERTSKKGNKYAYIQCSDFTGHFEAIVFSDLLKDSNEFFENHELLILDIEAENKDEKISFRIQNAINLSNFLKKIQKDITLSTTENLDVKNLKKKLFRYKNNEGSRIFLEILSKEKVIRINIPGRFDYFNIVNNKIEGVNILN